MATRAASPDDLTMQLQQRPTSTDRIRRRRSPSRGADDLEAGDVVGLALNLLESQRLSPMELRILLAVQDREVSLSELAERFGSGSRRVRQSAGSLYARGLLHWRYVDSGEESLLSPTFAGRRVVHPLSTAPV